MSSKAKTEEQKAEEKKKKAEATEAKKKAKEAKDAEAKEKADADKKEADTKKEGFIKEISDKINAAEELADLEALTERVFNIWGDDVPAEIQELAAKKGQEIELNKPAAKKASAKAELQKGWVKVTEKELKAAEEAGELAGYDPLTQTALINK